MCTRGGRRAVSCHRSRRTPPNMNERSPTPSAVRLAARGRDAGRRAAALGRWTRGLAALATALLVAGCTNGSAAPVVDGDGGGGGGGQPGATCASPGAGWIFCD